MGDEACGRPPHHQRESTRDPINRGRSSRPKPFARTRTYARKARPSSCDAGPSPAGGSTVAGPGAGCSKVAYHYPSDRRIAVVIGSRRSFGTRPLRRARLQGILVLLDRMLPVAREEELRDLRELEPWLGPVSDVKTHTMSNRSPSHGGMSACGAMPKAIGCSPWCSQQTSVTPDFAARSWPSPELLLADLARRLDRESQLLPDRMDRLMRPLVVGRRLRIGVLRPDEALRVHEARPELVVNGREQRHQGTRRCHPRMVASAGRPGRRRRSANAEAACPAASPHAGSGRSSRSTRPYGQLRSPRSTKPSAHSEVREPPPYARSPLASTGSVIQSCHPSACGGDMPHPGEIPRGAVVVLGHMITTSYAPVSGRSRSRRGR